MKETDKWSSNLEERRLIENFWEWLLLERSIDDSVRVIDVNSGKMLDKYHGINREKLEKERQLLVNQTRNNT